MSALWDAAGRGQGPLAVQHYPMLSTDLDRVLAIEVQAYSHPWSRGNFIDSLAAGYRAELRVDAASAQLLGYSVAMRGVDETHLLNLTVAPAFQRQGHGRALLRRVALRARAQGDGRLWLEVRESNASARALYRAAGFEELGLRKHYYPADRAQREHAVVMGLDLLHQPPLPALLPDRCEDDHGLD